MSLVWLCAAVRLHGRCLPERLLRRQRAATDDDGGRGADSRTAPYQTGDYHAVDAAPPAEASVGGRGGPLGTHLHARPVSQHADDTSPPPRQQHRR